MGEENQQFQGQTKKCPKCKEEIKIDAELCKHCGAKLDLGSRMMSFGQELTKFGFGITFLVIIIIILIILI